MELFLTIQTYAAIIGINRSYAKQKIKFNRRNVIILMLFGIFTILTTAYLYYDVHTAQEYAETFFAWITWLAISIGFFIMILKSVNLFEMFEHFEKTIECRK